MDPYALHWFRRDLRIAGNPGLRKSYELTGGRVVGVFFFDSKFLSRDDFSHNRFAFFLESLRALKTEMQEQGSDLWIINEGPDKGFERLLLRLRAPPSHVTYNRDYEPFARERDARIEQWLASQGIAVSTERDHLLMEPEEVLKPDGGFYQIFTPFSRRWFERMHTPEIQKRIETQKNAFAYLTQKKSKPLFRLTFKDLLGKDTQREDALESMVLQNSKKVTIPIPKAGSRVAYEKLLAFKPRIPEYQTQRDIPSVIGTSQLSPFLKNGSITPSMIIAELGLGKELQTRKTGRATYLKEIAWREFYYQILFHSPNVEHEAFLEKYRNLNWENREDFFEAWKEGRTGYPIVDAGMRQLRQTGWMHNRVRMIVASFLTKDLLIDYRWGEKWFMNQLLDGDLAPNNGGWQWAASTGCDPQPYFRIFNPQLQSERFDPEGHYIRKWVPELADLSSNHIHAPDEAKRPAAYPKPIVNHASRKMKALALYGGS